MSFSNKVPEVVLENSNTAAFLSVLDKLQEFKGEIISSAVRGNNYAMTNDKKWLIKYLSDYGVTNLPLDLPLAVIQQLLLNVGTLFSTRGSKIGLEFFCSVLTLGEVLIDDSKVYIDPSIIVLNSLSQGYLQDNNSGNHLYLVDNNEQLNPKTSLSVEIKSKYFNGDYPEEQEVIKKYLAENIRYWIGFSNVEISFNFLPNSSFYYHHLLNNYFV